MMDRDQRKLLGEFVRAHRERLTPDQPGGRRRTPGLRREELAARAGISATWCAWIEQGRDVQASPHALSRLARALNLTRAERAYMFDLAGRRDPEAVSLGGTDDDAPESLRDVVNAVAHPAYGLDRLWNACSWNPAAEQLFVGWLGEGRQRNLLRYVFLVPAARDLLEDWQHRAGRILAEFRADYGHSFADPPMQALIGELSEKSELFRALWKEQQVMEREGGLRRFRHPTLGMLEYRQHTYRPTERSDYKLVMLVKD